MNAYKAQIAALFAQSDKSPLDTAIFLARRSNEHRRDVWRVSCAEAVEEWIEKDRALFELQLDALYRAKASAPSDGDLVKLIASTIDGSFLTTMTEGGEYEARGASYGCARVDGHFDVNDLARAVLGKLRSAEVIQ